MRHSTRHRNRFAGMLASIGLAAVLLTTQGIPTRAGHAATGMDVTLKVYTCCGSLAGFTDTNPSDLASMHSVYSGLWSKTFPGLRWRETTFNSQAVMEKQLAGAVHAGTPPDMVFFQGGYVGYTVLRKLAQPLDNYFSHSHASNSSFLPGMAKWAHFGGHWWAIPAVSGPLGGQQIYLPKYMAPLGYNNSNLRTFDDYLQMSRKAVQFDGAGNLQRIGYWPGTDSWETIGTLMCPPGRGLYNAANQPTATDPCNVAYLQYLQSLADLYGGYAKLHSFIAADPDFLSGNRHAFIVNGKALISPSGYAYWNVPSFDAYSFGLKGGVAYQLTTLPPTVHGTMAEVANYPSTMQEVVIPRGAAHPAEAFAVSKLMFWEYNYLLGHSTSGSPVVKGQNRWLNTVISTEAATRQQAGLAGNPMASLQGLKLQPTLGLLSKASSPLNPVDLYYQQQLSKATTRVLLGQELPARALAGVQTSVLSQQQQLKAQFGDWNW